MRLTLTLTVVAITCTAVSNLLASDGSLLYVLALLALGAGAVLLSRRDYFDLYGLSGCALGINVCLVSGLGQLLLDGARGDMLLVWLLLGLMAAALLGCGQIGRGVRCPWGAPELVAISGGYQW